MSQKIFLFFLIVCFLPGAIQAGPIDNEDEILTCTVWVFPVWHDGAPHAAAIPVSDLTAQTPVLSMQGSVNRVTSLSVAKMGISYVAEIQSVDGSFLSSLTLGESGYSVEGTSRIETLRGPRGASLLLRSSGSSTFLYALGEIRGATLDCSVERQRGARMEKGNQYE